MAKLIESVGAIAMIAAFAFIGFAMIGILFIQFLSE